MDNNKLIVVKVIGFESDSDTNVKSHIITIPQDRFRQIKNNELFLEYVGKKVMEAIYEEAVRLDSDRFLSIEEVLEKLGYNECVCDEDKICIDKNKLKEYIDRK